MENLALLASLEARPGKEKDVEEFLKSARPLVFAEAGTLHWYAFKTGPSTFGIFDTFNGEEGRNAHVSGDVAKALFARAEELFVKSPEIAKVDILASKSH
jgi:quinol monooxygenase YgiN